MDVRAVLARLPRAPGVYLMRDAQGRVIYVGKAKSLRDRVASYFHSPRHLTAKTMAMMAEVEDVEVVTTSTEVEALILEQNLIKQHRPRFNVLLKDDKHYPYLKVTREPYPRIVIVRRMHKDGARYFGPFPRAGAVHETLRLMRRLFPLRTCSPQKFATVDRPCLLYHIKRCVAPCMPGWVTEAEYAELVREAVLFLEGRHEEVLRSLRQRMQEAAERWEFEQAAVLRDRIQAVERVTEPQKIVSDRQVDQDVVGLARDGEMAAAQVFRVRGGKLVDRDTVSLVGAGGEEEADVLAAVLQRYYTDRPEIPPEILCPQVPREADLIAQWLTQQRGGRVRLRVPKRGRARELVAMAVENARLALAEEAERRGAPERRRQQALAEVAQRLGLGTPPRRIEAVDVSTLQGQGTVASLVVFVDGLPAKDGYRRFRIREVQGQDDVASLAEAVRRRLARAQEEGSEGDRWRPLPDLLLVDGGRSQVRAVREELLRAGLDSLPVWGLAKEEELCVPPEGEPVAFPSGSPGLLLLQQVRDEAHRFALRYQRRVRRGTVQGSVLDAVPGIGPARRRRLLSQFGSVDGIRRAPLEELVRAGLPRKVAEEVKRYLG